MNDHVAGQHSELHSTALRLSKRLKTEAKGFKQSSRSKSSSCETEEAEETVDALMQKVLNALEGLLGYFNDSAQLSQKLVSSLEKVVNLLLDLHKKTSAVQQEQLRALRVLSGCRDFVSRFRYKIFRDVCHLYKEVAEQYKDLGSFMNAMAQEVDDYRSKRVRETPLYAKFIASVERLGLSKEEWRLVREFGVESVTEFHNAFTVVEQLETEVFPARFERYRAPLLKVAMKLQELEEGTGAQPEEFLL